MEATPLMPFANVVGWELLQEHPSEQQGQQDPEETVGQESVARLEDPSQEPGTALVALGTLQVEDTQQVVLELEGLPIMEELDTQLEEQHTLEVQVTLDTTPEVQDTLEELVIQLEV